LRAGLTLLLLALLPGTAQAATVRIADPAGDTPPTFNASTDLTALGVTWDGTLTVTATFAERPRTLTLDVVVSEASRAESDPGVQECHPRAVDTLTVIGTNDGGSLEASGVEGRLEVPAQWEGTTVTYAFRDATLDRELARRDPFACVSGTAGEDAYYGVFDGKVGKLTPATAREAVGRELARRFGEASPVVRCPRRTLVAEGRETGDAREYTASAFCAFTRDEGARYRMGLASVHLESGVPQVSGVFSRTFPRALRFCGITDFTSGWSQGPVFGASMSAWARGVPCRLARRIARRWGGRSRVMRFRCRRTRVGPEFVAVRCVRGSRVVRFESGA
jgi:hypothetical protein